MLKLKATLSVLALTAAFVSTQGFAQGKTGLPDALNVNVTNTASSPVPVQIVSPASSITCYTGFFGRSGSSSPFAGSGQFTTGGVGNVQCPSGITAIDVHRVLYDPGTDIGLAIPSLNVAACTVVIALRDGGSTETDGIGTDGQIMAMLTNGAPEKLLSPPVRLDKNSGKQLAVSMTCTSGIATYNPGCGGAIYFIGTPVQQ